VADAVRTLPGKTMIVTQEISAGIPGIQQDLQKTLIILI